MEYVNNVHARRWVDDDTPGYEYIDTPRACARVTTT